MKISIINDLNVSILVLILFFFCFLQNQTQFLASFSLQQIDCVKQLKMVVLVQFNHLEVIVVQIECIVMLVQIVQHHHNGNEKVSFFFKLKRKKNTTKSIVTLF